jgi:hypothetical protein
MTNTPATLLAALQTSPMLEINGLYTSDVTLGDELHIECMDGRQRKVWRFSLAQVQAATFDADLQSWVINDGSADHRILCIDDAFAATDAEDEDEQA